ncbi:MAG: ATP-binding protein, partial [Hyphomicrobiaceae bacterium]
EIEPLVQRLVGVMKRLPGEKPIEWRTDIPDQRLILPVDQRDLEEILGNLMDNARKWASGHVAVRLIDAEDGPVLVVEDDGPGVPETSHADILGGGVRLDRGVPGTGMGLAIVVDIASLYGGKVVLSRGAVLGGLKVSVVFPPVRSFQFRSI